MLHGGAHEHVLLGLCALAVQAMVHAALSQGILAPDGSYLVQVLSLRGRGMLMMPSTSDDLPALWLPHTTTVGRSSVNCAPAARIMLTMLTSLLASCWYLEELKICRQGTGLHHQLMCMITTASASQVTMRFSLVTSIMTQVAVHANVTCPVPGRGDCISVLIWKALLGLSMPAEDCCLCNADAAT